MLSRLSSAVAASASPPAPAAAEAASAAAATLLGSRRGFAAVAAVAGNRLAPPLSCLRSNLHAATDFGAVGKSSRVHLFKLSRHIMTRAAVEQSPSSAFGGVSLPTPVVPPAWLADNLSSVKVLDASWYMPAEKRYPLEEFLACRIPGASFFDIETIADPTTDLPHMLPTEVAFSRATSALGLSNSDSIVVYDGKGIFSAARAWWMFRAFGHERVAVLDGGLPQWKAQGFDTEAAKQAEEEAKKAAAAAAAVKETYDGKAKDDGQQTKLPFQANLRPELVLSLEQVQGNIDAKRFELVDARSAGRFKGLDPEPRAGVRGGSVPGSLNVPFPKVLSSEGTLLSAEELERVFREAGVSLGSSPVAASCGTGVTACILALALFRLGRKDVAVYDGSWTEWGAHPNTPVIGATTATTKTV